MIIEMQQTIIKLPDDFNMKYFSKFVSLYNALIATETRANIIRTTYYNNQGIVTMEQLRDHTPEEYDIVLRCWEDYSDFFKDAQIIFEIFRDSNFTQRFNKNMMKLLNNIYTELKYHNGWTIAPVEIVQQNFVPNVANMFFVPINRKIKIQLAFQTNDINIIPSTLHQ